MAYRPQASSGTNLYVPEGVKWDLSHLGYGIIRNGIPLRKIDEAKRLLNLEIVNWGLTKEQFDEWHQNKTWFPTLRNHEEIRSLVDFIPPSLYQYGELCEPQILCHYPDEATDWSIEWHQDKEPPWADDRQYTLIAGVALTLNNQQNGGLVVLPPFGNIGDEVGLNPGDIVVFNPKLWHRSGLNRTGDVRMMVYFRWLERKSG